jgi:hypothetical protein
MEDSEAAAHAALHRHDLVDEALAIEKTLGTNDAFRSYEERHAERLKALDASAPKGGHQAH